MTRRKKKPTEETPHLAPCGERGRPSGTIEGGAMRPMSVANPGRRSSGIGTPAAAGGVPRVKNHPMNTYSTPSEKRTKVEKTTW